LVEQSEVNVVNVLWHLCEAIINNDCQIFLLEQQCFYIAELHKATVAAQAFYSDTDEAKKSRSPWILKRLVGRDFLMSNNHSGSFQYDWSHRAKTREIIRHVQKALGDSDREFEDEELNQFLASKSFF
jgi:hypothetical protein